jgi:hypothetical protein
MSPSAASQLVFQLVHGLFRAQGAETRKTDKASRKAAMAKRVRADVPVGLLGYLGGEPMAWCSAAAPPGGYHACPGEGRLGGRGLPCGS